MEILQLQSQLLLQHKAQWTQVRFPLISTALRLRTRFDVTQHFVLTPGVFLARLAPTRSARQANTRAGRGIIAKIAFPVHAHPARTRLATDRHHVRCAAFYPHCFY